MASRRKVIMAALAMLLLAAAPVGGQDWRGYIDLERDIEAQIERLEQLVGGDGPARNQAVVLQWLIELYDSLGRTEDVARCYNRILALFPNDVGTLNRYGRYLMVTVEDYEQADRVLYEAHEWARATDARAVDLGTTFQLRAELTRRMGEYERSVRLADSALELLSLEQSGEALRIKAQSLAALERYDAAADTYLQLIGMERATNAEDINALKLIVPETESYLAGDVQGHIADAVEAFDRQYLARIELEGGTVVTFESEDGVSLEATFRHSDGPGAVLFVHDIGSRRSVFTPYAQLFYIDGISSLAVDLRGHGGSRADSMLSYEGLSSYHRDQLSADVLAAFRHLKRTLSLDDGDIAIVSAGSACAIVEKALHRERLAPPVVHLSPSFPATDRELATAISFHPDSAALIIAAREDLGALRAIDVFSSSKPRQRLVTRVYEDAGHGVEALRRVAVALEGLQEWLRRVVGAS
jgi:tetratricopeptide (TPR) repeat protein